MLTDKSVGTTNEIGALGFVQIPIPVLLDPSLTPPQKLLYAVLKRFTMNGNTCFPGVDRLRKATDTTDRTVQRNMDALIKRGLVVRRQRTGSTNVYLVAEPEDVYADDPRTRRMTDETVGFLRKAGEDKTVDKLLALRKIIDELKSDGSTSEDDSIDLSVTDDNVNVQEDIGDDPVSVIDGADDRSAPRFESMLANCTKRLTKSEEAAARRKARKHLRDHGIPKVSVEPDPEYVGGTPDVPEKELLTVDILEKEWRLLMRKMWPNEPGITPGWQPKHFRIANSVIDRFERDGIDRQDIFWAFLEVVRKWESLVSEFGLKGYPNVQLVAGYSDTWFPKLWGARDLGYGKITKREADRKRRGYDESRATTAEREGGITII